MNMTCYNSSICPVPFTNTASSQDIWEIQDILAHSHKCITTELGKKGLFRLKKTEHNELIFFCCFNFSKNVFIICHRNAFLGVFFKHLLFSVY